MNIKKKTKIIATIGPSCDSYDILLKMIMAGVNVCRLNFLIQIIMMHYVLLLLLERLILK